MNSQGSKQLPAGWSWIKLSDISKIFDCKHYTPTYVPKGIPLIRTNDTVPGFFSFGNTVYVSREDYEKLTDVNKPRRTDIVFAREGSFGVASFINDDREYAIGQRTMIIRADQSKIDPIYLTTYINSPPCQEELLKVSMGTTVKRVNVADVKELPIAVPPLAEQKRIPAIAQKADRLRRTRRYALQLGDTYLQSVFLEMFGNPVTNPMGWKQLKAKEIFEIQLGKMLSAKTYTGTNLYPYLRNVNVQWGYTDISDLKEMDFDDQELKKFSLKKGDILVCEGGEVGRTAIWQGEIEKCCYQKALHRLRVIKAIIEPHYFVTFMKIAASQGLILRETSQVTVAHFTAEKFAEFPVIVPPLPLQEKFAQIVQKFERLRTQQREADRQAEHLFQTLLHRAFRGELTPQDANDQAASVLLEEIRPEQAQAEAEPKAATQG